MRMQVKPAWRMLCQLPKLCSRTHQHLACLSLPELVAAQQAAMLSDQPSVQAGGRDFRLSTVRWAVSVHLISCP